MAPNAAILMFIDTPLDECISSRGFLGVINQGRITRRKGNSLIIGSLGERSIRWRLPEKAAQDGSRPYYQHQINEVIYPD